MSDCRSFGSNFRPSSQSRKISIGVLVDSLAKRKPGGNKEDQDKQANAERNKPSVGISSGGKNKGDAFRTSKGNQTEDNEQVKSPWITPRSLHRETLYPETTSLPKEASNPKEKKLNTVKDVPEINSFSFSQNQNFSARNVGSEQQKFDGLITGLNYKRKGRKDDNSQRVEEFNCANQWKDKVELEQKAGKTDSIQTETLKKKLHELFATVASPKSLESSLQSHKVGSNNSKQRRSGDNVGDTAIKYRKNSVDVEIVSENPDKTVKKPATRSLIQKRALAKVQLANSKIDLSSKQKHGDSILSFGEGRSANSPEEENADEIESLPDSSREKRGENLEKVQEKDSFHSPMLNETNEQVNFDNTTSPGKWDKQEDDGNISLRNFVHAQDDFQSPTFRFNTPILNTSSSPTPKTVEIERGTCSPVPFERGFSIRNIGSFRTFRTSGPASPKSNAEAQSSEDTEKHTASSLRNGMPGKETIDAVNEHSEPSSSASEEQFSETFIEGSPIIDRYDCHRENLISAENVISEKPNFEHCPIKRFRKEDAKLSEFSPTSPSQKERAGTGESYWFQEPLEEDQEDELTRAITLLALALESFKRKMDSATRKKSSEILMSISDEMKSMSLKAESQIESDVGKLTCLSKTKRKRLETRLQEQQDQLKMILEKFKEDIHHHLFDCNSILEGMEYHQNELKGIMKKQKVSHQKLLMHVEEAAKFQLNNAETRITAVHESAREKMLQLKHEIAECLTDIY
ncbi:meiosis-specific protein ASY3-like [Hibiscus syriacus]|uniref:meiosis-specific protein ASY3-like n=1 Tax=Hibiscus syriacus TaxID=106335 RepID=UPI001923FB0C|nr:meiosis-specific protein ASY3-like [Hibiscus syriacus]